MYIKWNPDFSNLEGKRKLVQKIGDSKKSGVKLKSVVYFLFFSSSVKDKKKKITLTLRGTLISWYSSESLKSK